MLDLEAALSLHHRVQALNAWIRTKCPASWIRPNIDEILYLSIYPYPERKSHLEALPPEILLQVVAFLPLESQACITVCSRTLSRKIGTECWITLQRKRLNHDEVYVDFLQLLQRDMPSFYPCRRCLKLHSMNGNTHSKPWREKDKGKEHYIMVGGNLRVKLAFDDIQLAMARHRYKNLRDGKIDAFHYAEYEGRPTEYTSQLLNMEARVVSGRLLLRTQTFLKMDLSSMAAIQESEIELKNCLCSHVNWASSSRTLRPRGRRGLAECFNEHDTISGKQECEICGFRPLCPHCPTETLLQRPALKPPLKSGKCLAVITQWLDLGSALIPEDRIWQAHINRSSPRDPFYPVDFANWGWTHPRWGLSRIRDRFEEQRGVTVEELTAIQLRRFNSGRWPSLKVQIIMQVVAISILVGYLSYRIPGSEPRERANTLDWLHFFFQLSNFFFQFSTNNFLLNLLESVRFR